MGTYWKRAGPGRRSPLAAALAAALIAGLLSGPPMVRAAAGAGALAAATVNSDATAVIETAAATDAAVLAGVEAPSVVVMDTLTGTVLLERDAGTARFPASLTKIMTLLLIYDALAAGNIALDDEVVISEAAAGWGGTQIFLAAGEVMSSRDLLRAVAVASANDAATALAEHVSGSVEGFVAAMNQRAADLGLVNTRFDNPHGIDTGLELADHHMSAMDLAVLARELINKHPDVLALTGIYIDKVRSPEDGECCELVNTNQLVRSGRGVDGLKTGHTSRANFGIAATALRDDARFLAVLMGHPNRPQRDREALRLLDWAFTNWEPVPIIAAGERVRQVQVQKGNHKEIDLVAGSDFGVLVSRGQRDTLEQTVAAADSFTAPVDKGQVLGRLTIHHEGRLLGSVDLVADRAVSRLSPVGLWLRVLALTWPYR